MVFIVFVVKMMLFELKLFAKLKLLLLIFVVVLPWLHRPPFCC